MSTTRIGSSFLASLMVSIGGCVYLSCSNKLVGSILFATALICICIEEFDLYTGKIGYLAHNHNIKNVKLLITIGVSNIVFAYIIGFAVGCFRPELTTSALTMVRTKLCQSLWDTLFRGFMCGVLMFMAVDIYKNKNSLIGVIFCIPTFILCGFEHSIADAFYFGTSQTFNLNVAEYIFTVIVGNTIGSCLVCGLSSKIPISNNPQIKFTLTD